MKYMVFLLLFILGLGLCCAAQQAGCTSQDVAVGVTDLKGEPFRGLGAGDFTIHGGKAPVSIRSLALDDGPRRVVLVVDQSRKLSVDGHRVAHALVKEVLAAARPQDSFALLTARGSGRVIKFGEDVSAMAPAVAAEIEGGTGSDIGVLDAVMQAISLFGERQPGDTILVIAASLEGNHKANPKTVAKALNEHGIRMFGLALGPVNRTNVAAGTQSTTAWGLATVRPGMGMNAYPQGDEDFIPLTSNSGGAVLPVINDSVHKTSSLNDPKVEQQVRQSAKVIFSMVASFYRMQLERSQGSRSDDWKLDINESRRKAAPQTLVLYPHQLGPC
ncbi:MAG TPA: hypothetical protein VF532_08985 [Candidatus Angelobacter sp.]